jgi:hypothetical protein
MTTSGPHESAQASAGAPLPIATVRSYDDLRRAVADWCRQIGMTREELDVEAGLTNGHASKLLSEHAIKRFGIVTLGRVMAAAGLVLIVAIDPDAPARPAPTISNANGSITMHWRKTRGTAWGRRMAALRTLRQTPAQRSAARAHATRHWRDGSASGDVTSAGLQTPCKPPRQHRKPLRRRYSKPLANPTNPSYTQTPHTPVAYSALPARVQQRRCAALRNRRQTLRRKDHDQIIGHDMPKWCRASPSSQSQSCRVITEKSRRLCIE